MPDVDFAYFEEGTPDEGADLDAVLEGVRFVRTLAKPLIANGMIAEEELPGPTVQSDDELRDYVREEPGAIMRRAVAPSALEKRMV